MLKIILTQLSITWCCSAFAQFSISGKVIYGSENQPLPGATVQLERGNYFSVTNEEGNFIISNVEAGNYVLIVRFLGYKEQRRDVVLNADMMVNITLQEDSRLTDEIVVYATRAAEKSPTTFTNINKAEIKKQNYGQDLPFVLNWSPSLVTTSDAGTGVGYTGLRIRGSDATRVNVTINGIPYNDSESQGVFWVNIPDIATSTQSIQIQRGVGTSTNGAGAFGASINLSTISRNEEPYADFINSIGSFNTRRHTLGFGTGLINDLFTFDARASFIQSDGFIDRASSDLRSYYFAAGYYNNNTIIKAIGFGGNEITYQSWYGVPEARLNNDVDGMLATAVVEGWNPQQTANLLNSNRRTFNIYDYKNQVDNYTQDHFQLHVSHQFSRSLTASGALHYTPGSGFYEEFKFDQALSDYGVADVVVGSEIVTNTDLVRRRWLDNDFYGFTYSVNYEMDRYDATFGGAWNRYEGDHFGEIIWAGVAITAPKDFRYYMNKGDKRDFNIFWKNNFQITSKINGYLDLQFRKVNYEANGIENDLNDFEVAAQYNFFNPKIGISYEMGNDEQLYVSYSVGQREPVRDDFINATSGTPPQPEKLKNIEAGWRLKKTNYFLNLNYYLMDYQDQLVLTGALNDVGAAIRTNVDKSYRSGIEIEGGIRLSPKISWGGNVTFSENKIKNFTEVIYDYGVNYDEFIEIANQLEDVDIAFSPAVIAGSNFTVSPFKNFEMTLLSKYVGEQFLDNTANESRMLDDYFINDIRLNYAFSVPFLKECSLGLLINNLFDVMYESNGYTYGFVGGGETVRQNYYYPQAGRNYLLMATLKF